MGGRRLEYYQKDLDITVRLDALGRGKGVGAVEN